MSEFLFINMILLSFIKWLVFDSLNHLVHECDSNLVHDSYLNQLIIIFLLVGNI